MKCKIAAIGYGFFVTLLIILYSLQVKPAENPCLVLAKVSPQIHYINILHYSLIY